MNQIRHKRIKEYVEAKTVASIKELQALFPNVSLMTIHRDLDALEQEGILVKFRGGVRSVRHHADVDFHIRMQENKQGKLLIAEKALTLLQPHTSIFLDASTTNLLFAQNMPDIQLNIVTTGPSIALELCRLHNPVVTVCGGGLNRKNLAISGINTLSLLDNINIDVAFMGVSGCSLEAGFTCGTEADMLVKQKVIQKARTTVLLCDSGKFSCIMPYTFARLENVDYIVTDAPLPSAFAKAAETTGVQVL